MRNKRKNAEQQAKIDAQQRQKETRRLQKLQARQRGEETRQRKRLAAEGRLAHGIVIPKGAVAADLMEQAPHNSYSAPLYYVDVAFVCVDCGVRQVWTAAQQKWYYEVAKGPIQAVAVRCRPCRQRQRAKKEEQKEEQRLLTEQARRERKKNDGPAR